ncbi:MAG TPA: ribonuclease H family protein [Anaerolineales bacterium]|nr:ribonuclease H family protein [Anaerolineales bacterium]
MGKAQKVYVVWKGRRPGVYGSWDECARQVSGFPGAEYKAFSTRTEAEKAFESSPDDYIGQPVSRLSPELLRKIGDGYAVDAACSGNPGRLEYRCVHIPTGREVFRRGPFEDGTNNVGEFLALAHALALFKEKGVKSPVYSDSETALSWVKDGRCKTQLEQNRRNAELFRLIDEAEDWLERNECPNKALKWDTEAWGEIPADFGRK